MAEDKIGIIGGGAGGLAAAMEARRVGHDVAIVSTDELGGDCTFTGCVPSKSLIESALRGASLHEAFAAARSVVADIALTENADVLRRTGVEVLKAFGSVSPEGGLLVDGDPMGTRGLVIATGSSPSLPPILGLESLVRDNVAYTSDTVWDLDQEPNRVRSIAIIGGGAIGCELGSALQRLGIAVTIVEAAPHVLPGESLEVGELVRSRLTDLGIKVITGGHVTGVSPYEPVSPGAAGGAVIADSGIRVEIEGAAPLVVDRILLAVGRQASTSGLSNLQLDSRGFLQTDSKLRTSLSNVYGAGDVTGVSNFTHAADAMGRLATSNLLRRFGARSFRPELVPRVVFVDPEVASIGISESEAALRYPKSRVAELPLEEHDRARISGRTRGFIKLIAAPRRVGGSLGGGRLVGATIVAPRAGELISELSLLMQVDAMVGRLAQTMHPYPSWSYGLAKAAGQFFTTVEGRTARPALVESK